MGVHQPECPIPLPEIRMSTVPVTRLSPMIAIHPHAVATSVVLLASGMCLWWCLPDTRGFHAQLGWLPLWTILSPALCLMLQLLRLSRRSGGVNRLRRTRA